MVEAKDEDDGNGDIKVEREVEKTYKIKPAKNPTILEKATTKKMESAFFKAVDDLVEEEDDCPDTEEEEDDKEYYDSVFEDYADTFKDVGKPDSILYQRNEIDDFFSTSREKKKGGEEGPAINVEKAVQLKVTVPGFGELEPGDVPSRKIPGYIDDRAINGVADTGMETVASVVGRLLVEEHESNALNDLD